jgi:aspartyl-tRNA(Asn)/glutamyl-tRNA(Gln) amidotransferase subunit A
MDGFFTILDARSMLEKGEISPSELASQVVSRVEEVEDKVKAFVNTYCDEMMERAKALENPKGPLWGIPLAVKDNICIKDKETTCSSKMLKGFIPPYNATVVERLEDAGYLLVGKTNLDEFAMGSSTENSGLFTTHNPWDLNRVPGGSSGGSAAAVVAGECVAAIGSDTGGSIRQPASFCGVVGLKPTYGRVSRFGLVAFASSLDQIGPITRTAWDAAYLLSVIGGHDPRDSTSAKVEPFSFENAVKDGIKGLVVGVPKEYFGEGLDSEVKKKVEAAISTLEGMGVGVEEISLPHSPYGVATYYLVATAEASSNLARYDGVKYGYRADDPKDLLEMYLETRSRGFGDEVKRRIMLGTYALSSGYYDAYYLKAQKVRTLIKKDFDEAFTRCDAIITPTSPTPAFRIGEKMDDPLTMYLSDIYTISVNLAGIPAVSIPCGFSSQNLPIGLQIIGRPFDEETILRLAHNYQMVTDHHTKIPPCGGE